MTVIREYLLQIHADDAPMIILDESDRTSIDDALLAAENAANEELNEGFKAKVVDYA
jgi:hypothetical protein